LNDERTLAGLPGACVPSVIRLNSVAGTELAATQAEGRHEYRRTFASGHRLDRYRNYFLDPASGCRRRAFVADRRTVPNASVEHAESFGCVRTIVAVRNWTSR
jgi:hypothetical protein